MPRFLLDTNILSDLVRHPQGMVAKRIAAEGEKSICTSIVVAGELHFGAKKRGSERLTKQLEAIISALEILPLEEPADRRYRELRTYLVRNRGQTTITSNRKPWSVSYCRAMRILDLDVSFVDFITPTMG